MSHAVARLRAERLARSVKPFVARGSRAPRCPNCRVIFSHCLCALRPQVPSRAGMCLIMYDVEPLKPSNTGWLIADVVTATEAFGWSRIEVDPRLQALLADPQWQPYVVFPGEFVAAERVVTEVLPVAGKRPLFVLLDATWPEARKMFRKSPYLNHLPVLSLQPEQLSRYRLRRSKRDEHLCTSEVAALCLELAGESHAAETLDAYLDVFTTHYLHAKNYLPLDLNDAVHQRLRALCQPAEPAVLPVSNSST
ncbi:MAG: DTW domain-containing protein YfiP [Pseudomonas sp.]|jgi:DTW domain-containing protein YfiP